MTGSFDSIYSHGFVRVAVGIPSVRVANPAFNANSTLELARQASDAAAALVLFPELGLTAYSNEDLFHQDVLLDAGLDALSTVVEASVDLSPIIIVGLPVRVEGKLFNCAVSVYRGQ